MIEITLQYSFFYPIYPSKTYPVFQNRLVHIIYAKCILKGGTECVSIYEHHMKHMLRCTIPLGIEVAIDPVLMASTATITTHIRPKASRIDIVGEMVCPEWICDCIIGWAPNMS